MSLASLEADQGHTRYGLLLLDWAKGLTAPEDWGVLLAQRGIGFLFAGRGDEAVRALNDAVAALDGNAAETANLALALLNRSVCHLSLGHVRRARADLVWCRRVATEGGHGHRSGQGAAQSRLLRPAGGRHSRRAPALQRGRPRYTS